MSETGFDPEPGVAERLAPGLVRVLAPNPSPMTFRGTNSYILGEDSLAVIDPGPDLPAHLDALMSAIANRHVSHIIVTHSHIDHAPLARPLSDATGAPIVAFGDSTSGRSAVMQQLAADGLAGGGEGVDPDFTPDMTVADGDEIIGEGWRLDVLHTPGHMGNHIALRWDEAVFTGDLVMGWASSLVSPPDGDLTDFLASCARLATLEAKVFHAGHGAPITDPAARLRWLIEHRLSRTAQIREALAAGPQSAADLAQTIYTDAPPGLLQAARRNVFAHLVDLHQKGEVTAHPSLQSEAVFTRA